MKILRVINSLNTGGAERSLETNVPVHIRNGYNMDILVLNAEQTVFMSNLEEQGVTVIKSFRKLSLYNPLHILKLMKYIRRYDVVHAHLFPSLYWVALAKIFSFGKARLIYTEHSTENRRRRCRFFRRIDQFIYNRYECIIAISEATKKHLQAYITHFNIQTIENGVDLCPFQQTYFDCSKRDYRIPDDTYLITQIASLREQKDQDTLLRALAKLPQDVHVALVGDGPRRFVLKELAQKLDVGKRVHFLGIRSDITNIIHLSDLVVLSSHIEGFGRAAVEGMASGKPVIGSNIPGLSGVIKDAGILFEHQDYEQLANICLQLKNDSQFSNIVGERCRKRAQDFSSVDMIKGYERIYDCSK